jgi:hypothetical protein
MKAGRPSYHVRAKWLTVSLPQGMIYFELDSKGNLVTGRPHHIHEGVSSPLHSPTQIPTRPPTRSVTPMPSDTGEFDAYFEDYDPDGFFEL